MFLISISIVLLFYYQCIVKPIVLHSKSIDFATQKSCFRIVKVQLLLFREIIFIKPRLLFVKQPYIYSEEADEL